MKDNPKAGDKTITTGKALGNQKETGEETPVKVNYKERQTVYSTDKDKHNRTGTEMKVTPLQAKDLLRRGLVSETKPESKEDAFEEAGASGAKSSKKKDDDEGEL